MNRKYFGLNARVWIAAVALVAVVVAVSAMSGDRTSLLAQGPTAAANGGTSYAKSLSQAFRAVANKTLPAVVMIKTSPVVNEQASEDDEDAGRTRTATDPFGNLPPEFRQLLQGLAARCPDTALPCRFTEKAWAPA